MQRRFTWGVWLVLWLVIACRPALEIEAGNPGLQPENGRLFYQQNPFTGKLMERRLDGTKLVMPYRDGWPEGLAQEWYADGRLASQREYVQDQKIGRHQGWYPDGKPRFLYDFVAGQHHGEFWEWYPNGQVYRYRQYQHGQEIGQKIWRENGKIYANYVVDGDRLRGLLGGRLCITVHGQETDEVPVNFGDESVGKRLPATSP